MQAETERGGRVFSEDIKGQNKQFLTTFGEFEDKED